MLLKQIWEDYSQDQKSEQDRWRTSVFKVKFPGRTKKRRVMAGMKRADSDLSIAPDPGEVMEPKMTLAQKLAKKQTKSP